MANHGNGRITRAARKRANPPIIDITDDDDIISSQEENSTKDLKLEALAKCKTLRVSLRKAEENYNERFAGQLDQVTQRQLEQFATKLTNRGQGPITRIGRRTYPAHINLSGDAKTSDRKRKAQNSQMELKRDAVERVKSLRLVLQKAEDNFSERFPGQMHPETCHQLEQFAAADDRKGRQLKQGQMEEMRMQGVELRRLVAGLDRQVRADRTHFEDALRLMRVKAEEDRTALRTELKEAREWRKKQGGAITQASKMIAELIDQVNRPQENKAVSTTKASQIPPSKEATKRRPKTSSKAKG